MDIEKLKDAAMAAKSADFTDHCAVGNYLVQVNVHNTLELIERLEAAEKQRDELLAAIEKLTDVFANIGITSGLYDDEHDALKAACDAIASVKEQK